MKTIIIIVALTVAGLAAFGIVSNMLNGASTVTSTTTAAANSDLISVTIIGEVNHTGTFSVSKNATLGDLIDAANGVNTNADSLAYDTSCTLKAKETYYIAPIYDNSTSCSITPIKKCNVNSADADTIVSVTSVSQTVANAIVNYRTENDRFACLEDLKNVSGIGAATYTKMRTKVTLRDAEV